MLGEEHAVGKEALGAGAQRPEAEGWLYLARLAGKGDYGKVSESGGWIMVENGLGWRQLKE